LFTKKEDMTVFISDYKCSYFVEGRNLATSLFDAIDLPEGVIVNGYIKEPEILYQLLLDNFKEHKIKIRHVNVLIHDQNLLIRNISIAKNDLQKKSINQYVMDQTDKKIYFPFETAAISHFIQKEDEENVKALALITDENLLHDYYDVFEKLGAKEVTFDLPALSLYELYKENTTSTANQIMLVTLYNKLLAIQIFVNDTPIFQMIEECDGSSRDPQVILENYIERIANYYKYNITKGKLSIEDIVIFNLNDHFSDQDLNNGVVKQLKDFNTSLYEFKGIDELEKTLPKACYLPYASLKTKDIQFQFTFEFKLERIKRVNIYGNYLMVISFLIFSSVALLYIPFFLFSEDIANQQNLNQGLENQLYILQRDLPESSGYTPEQIMFNELYDSLAASEKSYEPYLADLISKLNADVDLLSFDCDANDQMVVITITGTSRLDLDEYVIAIYEAYGITDLVSDELRWIVSAPEVKATSEFVMEVTLYHA
jgi:type IV pilus assembly protein PilM